MTDPSSPTSTTALATDVDIQQFRIEVVEGQAANSLWTSTTDRGSMGSHPSNDVVLNDRTVSRFHAEICREPTGFRLRDLGSRNGTRMDGVHVMDAWLRDGSIISIGQARLRFCAGETQNVVPLYPHGEFGSLVGRSTSMRAAFYLLDRAAQSNSTVLLEGETGTGKEEAAQSIHDSSERTSKPFVIVDCGNIPGNLLESELFGHERGAFSGAVNQRIGAFEAASGGTIFLDEIGEMPADLQPKLLRVLERKTIRRLGSNEQIPVNVRVVAATNRNLRNEVNEGRFRADLYYRLAVVRITLPPLRERPEDMIDIVGRLMLSLKADDSAIREFTSKPFMAKLQTASWPGNVRELRNYLEHCIVLNSAAPLCEESSDRIGSDREDIDFLSNYSEAKRRALHNFESRYLKSLIERHGGNMTQAARAAGVSRIYLHRLLRRSR